MKINEILEKLLEHWYIKLICFIAAIGLYIFNQTSQIEKKSFVLPLKVVQEGEYMNVGDERMTVNVVVRTTPELISSIHSNQIYASVNLNNITKSGTYSLPVNIKVNDELMAYDPLEIQVKPETVKINVDKRDLKYIELKPSIVGNPAHGYKIADIIVEPSYVQVEGSENILSAQKQIYTEKIDVTNAKKDLKVSTGHVNLNKLISVVDKGPYSIQIMIEPEEMEKNLANLNIAVKGLKENLEVISQIPVSAVKLSGTVPNLENYEAGNDNLQIDLSGITEAGSYEIPVKYIFPSSFKIIEKSIENLTVEIIEKPVVQESENEETVSAAVKEI